MKEVATPHIHYLFILVSDAYRTISMRMDDFLEILAALPRGYSEGLFDARRYGVTLSISADEKRWKLFAEELGGKSIVSFNLYFLSRGAPLLKPCEMPEPKVIAFVLGYVPETTEANV